MTERVMDEWPPEFNLRVYRGDSFGDDWSIEIPDLSGEGGPSSLDAAGVAVQAQIRYKADAAEVAAEFDCRILDPLNRVVQPYLTREQTQTLQKNGFWDLQVTWGDGGGRTILQGTVTLGKDKTR